MKEIVEKVYDDFERLASRKIEANNNIEVEVLVTTTDADGKTSTVKSLGRVVLDANDANTDTLLNKVGDAFKAGEKIPTAGSKASSSSTPKRTNRSGGRKGTSASAQQSQFNAAVRNWASKQERFSELSTKGRIPGEVSEAFKVAHPDWEQEYFPNSSGNSTAPAESQPATEQQVDVEPGPVQQVPDDEDDDDPPMDQTRDEDWTRAPEPQYTGANA